MALTHQTCHSSAGFDIRTRPGVNVKPTLHQDWQLLPALEL
jgi:hypothetical protein